MAKKTTEIEVSVAEVVDYLKMTGKFAPALREVVKRKITAETARKNRTKVTSKELQKAVDIFRIANGLNKARDTNKWLKSSGISHDCFEDHIETNLLISKFKDRLEKKTGKNKFLASAGIKESVKEMIYQDWLKSALK